MLLIKFGRHSQKWCPNIFISFYQYAKYTIPRITHIAGVSIRFLPLKKSSNINTFRIMLKISSWYESCNPNGGRVGLDLGISKQIAKITFSPRNDDNDVRPGDQHCLYYWIDGRWKLHECQIARTDSLVFKNVPTNAFLLLRNHTRGREERPFRYENGKQIWW